MINIRTDLAIEAKQAYTEENKREIDGIKIDEKINGEIKITTIIIENDEVGKEIGKPKGSYITMDIPDFSIYDGETMDEVANTLGEVLKRLVDIKENQLTLVVGLGNWNITADALGPKVSSKIMVTRHIKELMPEAIDDSVRPVCAISPGVLGLTGIETGEIIKSLVSKVKPDLVICVDALSSRKLERINRTIQISDTGISPGAGIGNKRMAINEQELGVKVIAIGVPTVVDASTIVNDTMDLLIDELINKSENGKEFFEMLNSIDKAEKKLLIRNVLKSNFGDLIVTPKEVDSIINNLSKIIANGINIATQPDLDVDEINDFII